MFGWLAGWLTGLLTAGWLVGCWLPGWLAGWLAGWQVGYRLVSWPLAGWLAADQLAGWLAAQDNPSTSLAAAENTILRLTALSKKNHSKCASEHPYIRAYAYTTKFFQGVGGRGGSL